MILIADSGSTKTDWCVVGQGQLVRQIVTKGMNPFFQSEEEIENEIATALIPHLKTNVLDAVYFYGAGCVPDKVPMMYNALSTHLNTKNGIEVNTDMLAVARGLCGHKPGIACIMGTGSNSCFYNGKIIVKNVRAGGYILGDEGSGAVLGKHFLSDVLKGLAPKDIMADFFEKFRISPNEVMESVYNRPFPNRFLSTISYFLADYTSDDYVYDLITTNLRNFFIRNVCQYDYKNYPIRFVGSLAYSYAKILREVANEFDIELDIIEETPMNGLIDFHSLNIEES